MTTDKVRVEIKKSTKGTFDVQIWAIRKYIYIISPDEGEDDLYTKRVFPDRDNWIDITLPEEINGCKRFEVNIKYGFRDGYNQSWIARMYPLIKTERTKVFYELQVTVY
jgi:hypothetical protein